MGCGQDSLSHERPEREGMRPPFFCLLVPVWVNFHQMGLSLESGEPSDGHMSTLVFFSPALLSEAEKFTLFIKNSITFPKFKVSR